MENLSLFEVETSNDGPSLAQSKTSGHTTNASEKLSTQTLCSIVVNQSLLPAEPARDAHAELVKTLQSPAVQALLNAGEQLAKENGVPAQEALSQIVQDLNTLSALWKQILLKEGLARLSAQLH